VDLGIDFGTTRTVVSACDRGNYPVLGFLAHDGETCEHFPSVVAARGDELRFGFDALAVGGDPEWTLQRSFKRWLGEAGRPDRRVSIGTRELPLGELLGGFLAALREAILKRSNLPKRLAKLVKNAKNAKAKEPLRAVVAAPANALGNQRFVTLEAFRSAGFEVVAMLNEPSAAGFEYSHRWRSTLSARREHVIVYDLGGGTFDASLVRMRGARHDAIATAGLARLGGDDFDALLADLVLELGGVDPARLDARARARLLEQCRDAKERLNPSSRKLVIDLDPGLGLEGDATEVVVPVARYYERCVPLVERTIEAMRPVLRRLEGEGAPSIEADAASADSAAIAADASDATDVIEEKTARTVEAVDGDEDDALSDALSEIAGIYVVGGASSLPIVGRVLRQRFGRRVHRSPYPSAAIAVGLAIAIDESSGFELKDRFARHFGVFREADAGRKVVFDAIFGADTELPRGAPLVVSREYRPAHDIGFFRFLECSALTDDGTPRGELLPFADVHFPFDPALRGRDGALAGVPVGRLDASRAHRFREQYALDPNGIVEVTISDLDDGFGRTYRIAGATPVAG
jgi:molecular chaperone DnaK (HSP70)